MNEETYDLYERYYHGELSAAEKATFKKNLANQEGFKEGYLAFRKAIRLVKNAGPKPVNKELLAVKAKHEKKKLTVSTTKSTTLEQIDKSSTSDKTAKIIPVNHFWLKGLMGVAASVGLLLFINYWNNLTTANAYNAGKIAGMEAVYKQLNQNRAEVYEASLEHGATPTDEDDVMEIFNDGMFEFSKNRYAGAIKNFKNYLNQDPTKKVDAANFYLGESFRIEGLPDTALIYLNTVNDDSDFYARKYNSIALILDRSGSIKEAAEALQKVMDSSDQELAAQVKPLFTE